MILKSKLLILIPILAIFSNNALAEMRQYPIGNSQVKLSIDHSKSVVTDFRVNGQRFSGRIIEPAIVDHMPSGARASAKVPLTIEASVSRRAVLSGAFGLVKRGAALGTRVSGWGTAAYLAYEAYQAVKGDIESQGYKWNEVSEEFLKEWPARNCLVNRDNEGRLIKVACYGVDSSVLSAYRKGGQSRIDAEQLMKGKMEKLAGPFWDQEKISLDKQRGEKRWEYFTLDECRFNLNGGDCLVKSGSDYRNTISFALYMRDTEVLDQETFLKIATQSIDGNPTLFVKGTGYPEYNEKVSVPAGTVVTIGPVTPENGKPVQISITFGQDSNGNTTANVETTQRPDLDPGSPEAPKSKPDGNPDSNPDGKPDKKPDGKPDKKPDDKPDPDGNPDKRPDDKPDPDDDPSDKRKEDKKDNKKEESKGLLCNVFPDILACSEKGDVEEQEEPFKIPHTNNETTFSPDFFLPDNGVCPAPRTATYLGITMEFKYDMICNFSQMIRFLVIGIAAVAAAFIMFSSRKD